MRSLKVKPLAQEKAFGAYLESEEKWSGYIIVLQTPKFVPRVDVFNIHKRLIEMFGGLDDVRDGLLDSDLVQPQATSFIELLHPTISA